MWLWSKGLGRLILPMELGKGQLQSQDDALVLTGRIVAPKVYWDYSLSLTEEDLLDFMAVLTHRQVVTYLAKESGLKFLATLAKRSSRLAIFYLATEAKRLVKGGKR